jgi:hypothetical protein
VVDALRRAGCFVVDLAGVGDSCPDALVGFRGRWVLLELKNGELPPSARKLRPGQAQFFAACLARGLPCFKADSPEEALRVIGEVG